MLLSEVEEEIANCSGVMTSCIRIKRSAEGINCTLEDRGQRMLHWRMPGVIHDEVTGGRWICLATARVY